MRTLIVSLLLSVLICVCASDSVDPDAKRNITDIITSRGYPCEEHFVTTPDGYILRMFRIPHGLRQVNQTRPPVLLQHGLIDSSFTWILNEQNQSLAYILADNGYDVWMGNNRGNLYSINHTTLKPDSKEFWEFSWDEMAKYDFPSMIDYVLYRTNVSKLAYVGHSEGSTQAFAGLIANNAVASKLSIFVAYGPVATVGSISTLLKGIADMHVDFFFALFGVKQFLPTPTLLSGIFVDFCKDCPLCCEDVIEVICGPHKGVMNESRMPVMAAHEPGGTSVQNMQHWAQSVRSGVFQMFDYGLIGNMERYGKATPPYYDFSQFPPALPVALFSGGQDELADHTDVKKLVSWLPNVVQWLDIPDYAHLDFTWDIYAAQQLYPSTLQLLRKYQQ